MPKFVSNVETDALRSLLPRDKDEGLRVNPGGKCIDRLCNIGQSIDGDPARLAKVNHVGSWICTKTPSLAEKLCRKFWRLVGEVNPIEVGERERLSNPGVDFGQQIAVGNCSLAVCGLRFPASTKIDVREL